MCLLTKSGNSVPAYLPISFKSVAEIFSADAKTVAKIWKNFRFKERTVDPLPKGGNHNYNRKLSDGDRKMIELLKRAKGSTQYLPTRISGRSDKES